MSANPSSGRLGRFLHAPVTTVARWSYRRRHQISPWDTMFSWEDREHYSLVGGSALACVDHCLEAARIDSARVRRILDFGCGHGRVLRRLKVAFPDAAFTASDQDASGVDFCAETFGARAIYSSPNPAAVSLEGPYDLIWVGSVFTHLDTAEFQGWLATLGAALAEGGVLVLTTHGPHSIDLITEGTEVYGPLSPEDRTDVSDRFRREGFSFFEYRDWSRNDLPEGAVYGNSFITPEVAERWVTEAGFTRVAYLPAGWDDHQDVYGLQRT